MLSTVVSNLKTIFENKVKFALLFFLTILIITYSLNLLATQNILSQYLSSLPTISFHECADYDKPGKLPENSALYAFYITVNRPTTYAMHIATN